MEKRLQFEILPQPDDTACGPTCLHALYAYYGHEVPLESVAFTTEEGAVRLEKVQPEGGRAMSAWEYAQGRRVRKGDRLSP